MTDFEPIRLTSDVVPPRQIAQEIHDLFHLEDSPESLTEPVELFLRPDTVRDLHAVWALIHDAGYRDISRERILAALVGVSLESIEALVEQIEDEQILADEPEPVWDGAGDSDWLSLSELVFEANLRPRDVQAAVDAGHYRVEIDANGARRFYQTERKTGEAS